jgi:ribosome-associated heat shock protein Hsp15
MRIDKYLWSTRYFKTRSLATAACRKGQVRVGDQPAKPSREVFPGDIIGLRKDQVNLQLTVLALPDGRVGAKLVNLYREDTTPAEAMQHKELLKQTKEYYRKKGSGRPTKKDRREIDDFLTDDE